MKVGLSSTSHHNCDCAYIRIGIYSKYVKAGPDDLNEKIIVCTRNQAKKICVSESPHQPCDSLVRKYVQLKMIGSDGFLVESHESFHP